MLSKVIVEGYKSFRDRHEVPLGRLTLLAGANSSGKSSLMQGLLLLKQTFDLSSDPGPLYLVGPHVTFERSWELTWKKQKEAALLLGLVLDEATAVEVKLKLRKKPRGAPPFMIQRCTWKRHGRELELVPQKSVRVQEVTRWLGIAGEEVPARTKVPVEPRRTFLVPVLAGEWSETGERFEEEIFVPVERAVRGVLHVPALRGNPTRTYPVRAYTPGAPVGSFLDYVASVLAEWQRKEDERHRREKLQAFLRKMGLTWKIQVRHYTDTQLEVLVGRTAKPLKGGAKDVVNMADVGFGVSQVLPVLVSLLAAEPGQVVYIEQPEIHLHPNAQVALADIVAEVVAERPVQVVLETHSQLMLVALQRAIAQGRLPAESVILHWFERDEEGATRISTTGFTPDGAFENPEVPEDFSAVANEVIRTYLEAAWTRQEEDALHYC